LPTTSDYDTAQQNPGPQPNLHNFVQAMNTAMNEAMLIPNIPIVGQGNQITQLLQQIQADVNNLQITVNHMRAELRAE
jgi:hypothetical protein